ncbi:hypothetical protein [Variovorax sp. JS1663]|uniref:hypothetical protein n=1 Tax=Variovorax sp. JS1663 TaxID=1851577 RepID=UPI000B3456B3|nr:hypothetical protein [Variovorax sp. JS1663]
MSNLPPLPKPYGYWHIGESHDESDFFLAEDFGNVGCPGCINLFTLDQMRAYAEEAVRLEREAIAADWEHRHGFDKHGVADAIRSRSEQGKG